MTDKLTGITAYAAFDTYQPQGDKLFSLIPAETMVMQKASDKGVVMSVCDPNLVQTTATETTLTVTCQHGQPVEFRMIKG